MNANNRPWHSLARLLFGFVGFFAGAILGSAVSYLFCDALSQGDSLGFGFAMLLGAPVGILAGGISGVFGGLRLQRYLMQPDPKGRERNARLGVVASLLVCYPSAIAAIITEINHCDAPPSDRALIADFTRHRQDLDQIVTMLHQERGLKRVGDDWTEPANPAAIGIRAPRIADYRRLLRAVGAPDGVQIRGEGPSPQIEFRCWGRGSAVSSDHFKGYAYLSSPPGIAESVGNLDAPISWAEGFCHYRHITGNWYLYYWYIPG